jgi:hypothetical protein
MVPLDGGTPRQITRDGEANDRPRWAPELENLVPKG